MKINQALILLLSILSVLVSCYEDSNVYSLFADRPTVRPSRGSCGVPPIKNGAAKLKKRGTRIRYKCYRNFVIVGPEGARCLRGRWWPSNIPFCVSTGCQQISPGPGLELKYVENLNGYIVPNTSVVAFTCAPGHLLVGDPSSWCDSILWNSSVPSCQVPWKPPRLSCNFNDVDVDQACGWTIDTSTPGGTVWKIMNGLNSNTPSRPTGPTRAYDGSWYLYLNSSQQLENRTARFISPVYTSNYTDDHCLKFNFYMQGADMGSLKIYQKPEQVQDPVDYHMMGEYSGNYGPGWKTALLPFKAISDDFQIILDGVVGRSYLSDIGVDNIRILNSTQCIEENKSYEEPEPLAFRSISPVSCWGRCNMSTKFVEMMGGWKERSACSCKTGCMNGPVYCCSDYLSECSVTKISTDFKYSKSNVFMMSTIGILACGIVIGLMLIIAGMKRGGPPPGERLRGDGDDMEHIVPQTDHLKDGCVDSFQDLDVDLRNTYDLTYAEEVEAINKQFEQIEKAEDDEKAKNIIVNVEINENHRKFEDLENIDFTLSKPALMKQELI